MYYNIYIYTHCRFAVVRAPPPVDASQDITGASASRMDGVTTVTFTRPRNSGDSNDISLDVCRFFLFAFGPATVATGAIFYHGSNRFISPDRICIPTFAECSGKTRLAASKATAIYIQVMVIT